MKLTTRDKIPIGKAQNGAIHWKVETKTDTLLKEEKREALQRRRESYRLARESAVFKIRRSDRSQLSWNTLCLTTGRNHATVCCRAKRLGISKFEAFLQEPKAEYTIPQHPMSWRQISAILGVDQKVISTRRLRGWNVRQALGLDPPPAFVQPSCHRAYWRNLPAYWRRQPARLLQAELQKLKEEFPDFKLPTCTRDRNKIHSLKALLKHKFGPRPKES